MFESLEETIRQDDRASSSTKERVLVWVSVGVISVLVFGGLYLGVRLLS